MVDKVDRSNKYEPNNVEEVEKVIKDGGRWELRCAKGDIRNHRRASIASQEFTSCIIPPWLFMREPPR